MKVCLTTKKPAMGNPSWTSRIQIDLLERGKVQMGRKNPKQIKVAWSILVCESHFADVVIADMLLFCQMNKLMLLRKMREKMQQMVYLAAISYHGIPGKIDWQLQLQVFRLKHHWNLENMWCKTYLLNSSFKQIKKSQMSWESRLWVWCLRCL